VLGKIRGNHERLVFRVFSVFSVSRFSRCSSFSRFSSFSHFSRFSSFSRNLGFREFYQLQKIKFLYKKKKEKSTAKALTKGSMDLAWGAVATMSLASQFLELCYGVLRSDEGEREGEGERVRGGRVRESEDRIITYL
jgi:hypothetical protein